MLNKILATIDRSPANQLVFREALSLAKATKANLILLHVLSGEEKDSPIMSEYSAVVPTIGDHYMHLSPQISHMANELYQKQWKEFEEKGIEILRYFAKEASAAGVSTEFSQITGHPSSTICNFAQSCHADVIVIGRRGFSGLKEIFLGSVSNYVVHHAPCSVLLVQTPIQEKQQSSLKNVESTNPNY